MNLRTSLAQALLSTNISICCTYYILLPLRPPVFLHTCIQRTGKPLLLHQLSRSNVLSLNLQSSLTVDPSSIFHNPPIYQVTLIILEPAFTGTSVPLDSTVGQRLAKPEPRTCHGWMDGSSSVKLRRFKVEDVTWLVYKWFIWGLLFYMWFSRVACAVGRCFQHNLSKTTIPPASKSATPVYRSTDWTVRRWWPSLVALLPSRRRCQEQRRSSTKEQPRRSLLTKK